MGSKTKETYLNVLMHMVVDVLAGNSGHGGGAVLASDGLSGVFEACLLGSKLLLDLIRVVMLEVAVLNSGEVVVVLLREDVGVLDGLDRSVVVVLVDFLVDSSRDTVFLLLGDSLVDDGGVDLLVDGGVMLTILADEALDCVLGGVHVD